MAQQLRAHMASTEDSGSVPRTSWDGSQLPAALALRDMIPYLASTGARHTHGTPSRGKSYVFIVKNDLFLRRKREATYGGACL